MKNSTHPWCCAVGLSRCPRALPFGTVPNKPVWCRAALLHQTCYIPGQEEPGLPSGESEGWRKPVKGRAPSRLRHQDDCQPVLWSRPVPSPSILCDLNEKDTRCCATPSCSLWLVIRLTLTFISHFCFKISIIICTFWTVGYIMFRSLYRKIQIVWHYILQVEIKTVWETKYRHGNPTDGRH